MKVEELFRVALGLESPWAVSRVEFSGEPKQLDIWLDFPAGSRFPCPECDQDIRGAYDSTERTWRHLNFFEHQTLLHARLPRVECPTHGVKTVAVPWARSNVGFTLLMEAYILLLTQGGMTAAQVARTLGVHDTRIWRVLDHYVEDARARADHGGVTTVGIDETSRARGHDYISVFTDMSPTSPRRVIFACAGRDADAVRQFTQDLQAHQGAPEKVTDVCCDMSKAYIRGVADHLPRAAITFDRFHIMKLAGDAIDQVRRAEVAERPELKKTRYLWLRNAWHGLPPGQEARWEQVRRLRCRTHRAWMLKTVLQDIFEHSSPEQGPELLQKWCAWAARSRLSPMVEVARSLRRHWQGVVRWFQSHIANGVVEAINGLIQSAKRRARGFRSVRNLITMIYLLLGKLDLQLPSIAPVPVR